jgi:HAD superfamily hydrolase (TIGR01509 family)
VSPPEKNFVFDFGRVVFRWEPEALLRELLPQHAFDATSAAHWTAQFFQNYGGDWGSYDRGSVTPEALVQRIAARTGLRADEVQRVVDGAPRALTPLPDSVALLQRLHAAGRPLYYLSNMPAPMAAYLQATHGFLGLFDDGVFSSRVGHNKPEPAIYDLAAQRFGHAVEELVFLDDHGPNVDAARARGWNALQFHTAAQAEAEMRAAGWL